MSLTFGTGPFAAGRGGYDVDVPEHVSYWEPWPRRMRAVLAGATVLDSGRGVVVFETGRMPEQWYPLDDLDASLLEQSEPGRSGEQRWDVRVGDRVAKGAVRSYAGGSGEAGPPLDGFVRIVFGAMDRWFEEQDPVYAHLRDPYHRVDVRSSDRHVVVRVGDRVVADSRRPKLLFETGLPVRYYLPFADVDLGRLALSDTVSECPYKGDGQHWHVVAHAGDDTGDRGDRVEDAAWSLPHPLPEAFAAAEHVSFYTDKVQVEVDGERVTD